MTSDNGNYLVLASRPTSTPDSNSNRHPVAAEVLETVNYWSSRLAAQNLPGALRVSEPRVDREWGNRKKIVWPAG